MGQNLRYCTKVFVSSVSLNTVLFHLDISYDALCACENRSGKTYCSK